MSKTFFLSSVCIFLAACGSTTTTLTGPKMPSRGEHCEFQLLTVAPAGNFVEIGAIDVKPGGYGTNQYSDVAAFKAKIEPEVCGAGGDAALAFANGLGFYMKATILKSGGATPSAPAAEQPPSAGCQYDTQCKGDRVCQKGECVDAVKK